MTSIATGGADYPVRLPALRPLDARGEQAALTGHLGQLLRELAALSTGELDLLGRVLLAESRTAAGPQPGSVAPYRGVLSVAALLVHVVDAHTEAAAALAEQLAGRT